MISGVIVMIIVMMTTTTKPADQSLLSLQLIAHHHWTEVQIKAENDEQQECGSDEDAFFFRIRLISIGKELVQCLLWKRR